MSYLCTLFNPPPTPNTTKSKLQDFVKRKWRKRKEKNLNSFSVVSSPMGPWFSDSELLTCRRKRTDVLCTVVGPHANGSWPLNWIVGPAEILYSIKVPRPACLCVLDRGARQTLDCFLHVGQAIFYKSWHWMVKTTYFTRAYIAGHACPPVEVGHGSVGLSRSWRPSYAGSDPTSGGTQWGRILCGSIWRGLCNTFLFF